MAKTLFVIGAVFFVLILIVSIFLSSGALKINSTNSIKTQTKTSNSELGKYRSDDIPEDCKLPAYENDVEAWKEHLSHHQNTLYCLDYYK